MGGSKDISTLKWRKYHFKKVYRSLSLGVLCSGAEREVVAMATPLQYFQLFNFMIIMKIN